MNKFKVIAATSSVFCITFFLCSCGVFPEKVALNDPRLVPMFKAMDEIDRASLGFTPLSGEADIRLEGAGRGYDAMLHIYEKQVSRTIAFRKTANGFKWIGEEEIHTGPNKYEDADGIRNEDIIIIYQIEPMTGIPLNQTYIVYNGDDPRLANRWFTLTLTDVVPVLTEWQRK
jgi:hypothetical protein